MEYLDEELDITSQKILRLEKEIEVTREMLVQTIESLKETQRYLVKLAYNQADVTRKFSHWPFIAVSSEKDN